MPHLRSVKDLSLAFKLDVVLKTDKCPELQSWARRAGSEVCAQGAVGRIGGAACRVHAGGCQGLRNMFFDCL